MVKVVVARNAEWSVSFLKQVVAVETAEAGWRYRH
jgi:hypothetical protein